MVLFGTIIDGVLIIVGSLLGVLFTNIPERYKETVIHGIGLTVILIGLQMAFETDNIIIVLISILLGALIGELLQIEEWLTRIGNWIASKFSVKNKESSISQGFVTASLIFVIGAMSILGALDSGLRGNHEILITKGIIDGFTSIVLTTTLGIGVLFSVVPVILYQGSIALLATQIEKWIPEAFLTGLIDEISAVGGLLILALGLNLMKLTSIRVGNLLPSIVTVGIVYFIYQLI